MAIGMASLLSCASFGQGFPVYRPPFPQRQPTYNPPFQQRKPYSQPEQIENITLSQKQIDYKIKNEQIEKRLNMPAGRPSSFYDIRVSNRTGFPININREKLILSFDCDYTRKEAHGRIVFSYTDPYNFSRRISSAIEVSCIPLTAEEQAKQVRAEQQAEKRVEQQRLENERASEQRRLAAEEKRRLAEEKAQAQREAKMKAENDAKEEEERQRSAQKSQPETAQEFPNYIKKTSFYKPFSITSARQKKQISDYYIANDFLCKKPQETSQEILNLIDNYDLIGSSKTDGTLTVTSFRGIQQGEKVVVGIAVDEQSNPRIVRYILVDGMPAITCFR